MASTDTIYKPNYKVMKQTVHLGCYLNSFALLLHLRFYKIPVTKLTCYYVILDIAFSLLNTYLHSHKARTLDYETPLIVKYMTKSYWIYLKDITFRFNHCMFRIISGIVYYSLTNITNFRYLKVKVHTKLPISQNKFSGSRKLNLRYRLLEK